MCFLDVIFTFISKKTLSINLLHFRFIDAGDTSLRHVSFIRLTSPREGMCYLSDTAVQTLRHYLMIQQNQDKWNFKLLLMFLTSTVMNDTTAIFCDTCASEDHYHAVCTEKMLLDAKVLPKAVSYSQDQKETAEKQKEYLLCPFSLLQHTY